MWKRSSSRRASTSACTAGNWVLRRSARSHRHPPCCCRRRPRPHPRTSNTVCRPPCWRRTCPRHTRKNRRCMHFAPRDTMKKTPDYDKLDVYSNDDSGSGNCRAVQALRHAQLAGSFPSRIAPVKDLGIQAVTGLTAGPTTQPGDGDSTQLQPDRAERHRLHTGSAGVRHAHPPQQHGPVRRVQKGDAEQGAMMEAWFAYNAATWAEMLPQHAVRGSALLSK